MKNKFTLLTVFLMVILKAQSISDYQYVVIPAEFSSLKQTYGMDGILKKSLSSKKYVILPTEKNNWPNDALVNPCKILNADILNEKSLLRNKISLQFKDCKNQVIYSEKSSSTIKEFEEGFQDAMRQAVAKLPASNPKETVAESAPAKEIVVNNVKPETKAEETKSTSTAQKFSKANMILQKIQIDNDQFILVDGNSSVPFATFKATAKIDVFRVKLSSGESTIGYYENGNIIIEMPKGGDFVKEVFMAK